MEIIANHFVLCCPMRPINRFGVNTIDFHVLTPIGNKPMGIYNPTSKTFRPIKEWRTRFGTELIKNVGLKGEL